MLRLQIDRDVKKDLDELARPVAQRIAALLQEIQGDPDACDTLLMHDFGRECDQRFHVSRWQEQWRQGLNLWRLKDWDLQERGLQYRIIYGYAQSQRCIFILGVAHRRFNYDENHPLSRRVIRRYHELCVD